LPLIRFFEILSNYQFGTDPKVEKIHFMQHKTPLGYIDDFLNRRILALRDFNLTYSY